MVKGEVCCRVALTLRRVDPAIQVPVAAVGRGRLAEQLENLPVPLDVARLDIFRKCLTKSSLLTFILFRNQVIAGADRRRRTAGKCGPA